jgi:hypothetical protein
VAGASAIRCGSRAPRPRGAPSPRSDSWTYFPRRWLQTYGKPKVPALKTQSSGMKPKVSELHPISLLCPRRRESAPPNASKPLSWQYFTRETTLELPGRVWNGQRIAKGAHKSGMLSGPRSPCWPHWASRFRAVIFSISPSYLTHVQPPSRYEFLNGEKGVFHAQLLTALEIMGPDPQLNR